MPAELPVVLINSTSPMDHPSVLPAEYEAGQTVARVLLEAGHRDIALIGYSPELAAHPRNSVTIQDRYDGILGALAEYGVTPCWTYDSFVWEPQVGYEAMQQLLAADVRPTGLITLNDRLAFGAYQALAEHNLRVPDDLSIASFDDDVIASYLRPGLTTAAIPYEEMGRRAMAMLLGEGSPEHLLIPMPLRLRDSVRPL